MQMHLFPKNGENDTVPLLPAAKVVALV